MNIDYKKFLPSALRSNRWGQFIEVFQSIVEDIRQEKIDIIKLQYEIENMTTEDIVNLVTMFGYQIKTRGGYTETYDYVYKQLVTLIPRIINRATINGYNSLFFIYNLTGTVYPTYIDESSYLIPIENWWEFNEVQNIHDTLDIGTEFVLFKIPYRLDSDLELDDGMNLDTYHKVYNPSEEVLLPNTTLDAIEFPNLDMTEFLEKMTRHLIIHYEFQKIENEDEFLSENTLLNLYEDVFDQKRFTEIAYFEPKLVIETNSGGAISNKIFYNYDNTISTNMQSILIGTDLSNVATIKFGIGKHATLSGAITDLAYTIDEYLVSDFDFETQTNTKLIGRRKLTEKDRCKSFTEFGLFDSVGDCVYYAKFPAVLYLSQMYSNIYLDITLI